MHVYMSIGKRRVEDGMMVNPRTGALDYTMRYRGKVGKKDDPEGFRKVMAKGGHVVEFHNEKIGTPNARGHYEYQLEH